MSEFETFWVTKSKVKRKTYQLLLVRVVEFSNNALCVCVCVIIDEYEHVCMDGSVCVK